MRQARDCRKSFAHGARRDNKQECDADQGDEEYRAKDPDHCAVQS
jgi:hypothetical protein